MMIKQKSIFRILLKIARKRDIIVKYINLPDCVDGLWLKRKELEFIMLDLDKLTDLEKRNFVFAHELGHSTLHKDKVSNVMYWKNNSNNNYKKSLEDEANNFAKNLIGELTSKCY
ncbi:ImmA/IrrE family metallo-endopeptidase [Clostridium sp. D2Q-14]|uniref:ImmA/IrrE family metallo-endopeptidase n=1 Tax=Anaeromonas gelatinilytica TaxID=2683194 RepID=UPI00193AFF48|nr:ImmA/IrrE family metallo-endopeptidase [Anaeromonas gelatinilytica]MBS4534971.1 ImmA/IrrE family metallo-endopeptidase [Anaeromonas gelatinilytica]